MQITVKKPKSRSLIMPLGQLLSQVLQESGQSDCYCKQVSVLMPDQTLLLKCLVITLVRVAGWVSESTGRLSGDSLSLAHRYRSVVL